MTNGNSKDVDGNTLCECDEGFWMEFVDPNALPADMYSIANLKCTNGCEAGESKIDGMCFKVETCTDELTNGGCKECVMMDKMRCSACHPTFVRTHLLECVSVMTWLSGADCTVNEMINTPCEKCDSELKGCL